MAQRAAGADQWRVRASQCAIRAIADDGLGHRRCPPLSVGRVCEDHHLTMAHAWVFDIGGCHARTSVSALSFRATFDIREISGQTASYHRKMYAYRPECPATVRAARALQEAIVARTWFNVAAVFRSL